MMPDLGKYAVEVLSAYAVTIVLIVALIGVSLYRARQVRASLREVEARQEKRDG